MLPAPQLRAQEPVTPDAPPPNSLFLPLMAGGGGESPKTENTDASFRFLADPLLGTVVVESSPSPQARPATARSSSRILLADSELSRVQFTYEFQTGNRLVIRAAYRNVTSDALFLQPFFFSRNAKTDNIVSSVEPLLSADDLGGDGILSPDETSRVVVFEVVHKGQPFTYAVDANAPVELLSGQSGPTSPAVFTGEVYDDSSGLALSGVTVEVVSKARSLDPTVTRTVTDERGRYRLVSEDRDVWVRFVKDGYTGSERAAAAPGDSRVELFDARLTPLDSAQTTIPAVSGGVATASDSRYSLTLQPFALQNDSSLRLTPIGGQSIAGLLPKGWSPVAAVQIDPTGLIFNPAAVLTLPAPDGLPETGRIVVGRWESALQGWVAVSDATRNGDNTALQLSVSASGQYVLLLADAAPNAPTDPLIGAILRQAATPRSLPGDPAVAMSPSDRILLAEPGRKTQVGVTAIAAEAMQSGMAYQVEFVESYEFVDGATIYPEPNIQDFVFYSFPGGPFRLESDFNVTPSRPFELATLRLGAVTLRLRAPVGLGLPSGELVGLTGSTVTGAGGETLDFPAAATLSTLPVVLTSLDQSGFPVALPADFTFLKGVQIDFAGAALQRPATLSAPAPAEVTGSDQLLLLRLVEVGSDSRLALAGRAQLLDGRLVAGPDTNDGLPFYGVRREGRYAFVKVSTPRSFVYGVVAGTNGQPLVGGLVSAENQRLAAQTDPNGQYVLAVPAGPVTVIFANPQTNDQASRSGEAGATPLQLNVSLSPTPPSVQNIFPTEGATGISLSSAIVVSFTESIDAASVNGESVRLLVNSEALPGSLSITPNRRVVVLRPSQLLASDTLYTIDISTAVRDLNGRPLTAAVATSFRTADTTPPLPPPAGSVTASVPEGGCSTVTGSQGTVQPDWIVVIKNLNTGALTTVRPEADGSFSACVPAEKHHKLQLQMQDAAGNRTEVAVGRFTSPDGSVVVGSEGGTVEGAGGTAVDIPAGAFPDGTLVKVSPISEADLPIPAPGTYPFAGAVELTTDGVRSRSALNLSVPAPADASPDDQVVVARYVTYAGGSGWMVADRAVLQDGRYTTAASPVSARAGGGDGWDKGILGPGQYAFLRSSGGCTSYVSVEWNIGFDFVAVSPISPFIIVPGFYGSVGVSFFPAACNTTLEITLQEINTGRVFQRINRTAPTIRNAIAAAIEKSISDDKKPPKIVRHNLYNGYQMDRLEIYFSKLMNPDSVLNGLRLTSHSGPAPAIEAAMAFSDSALFITPTVPFQFSIQYTLELNDAEDIKGNPLGLKEPLRFSIFEPQGVSDLADISGPALGSQAVAQIGEMLFVARTPTITGTTGLVVDIPIQELRVYSTTVITKPVEMGVDYTGLRHLRALAPIADVFAESTDISQTIRPYAIFTVTVESQAEALTITTGLNTDVISPALASLFANEALTLSRKAEVHQFTPQPGTKWFIESRDRWYMLEQLDSRTFRASVGRDLLVVLGTTEPTSGKLELLEIYDVTPCTKPQFVPHWAGEGSTNCLDIGRMTISRKVLADPNVIIPLSRPIPNKEKIVREIGVPLQMAVLHQRTSDTVAVYVVTSGIGLQGIDVTLAPNMPFPLFTDPAPNALLRGRFRDVAVLKNLVLAGEDPLNNNFPRLALLTPQLTRMKNQDETSDLVVPFRGFLAVTTAENVHYDVDEDGNFGEIEDEDGEDVTQAIDELFDLALVTTGRIENDRNLLWVVDLSDYTDLTENKYAKNKGPRVIDGVYLPMPARTVQADPASRTAYVEVDGDGLYAIDLRRLVTGLTSDSTVDSLSFPTFDDEDHNNSDDRILGFYRMVGISNRQEIVVDPNDNRPLAYLNEFNNGVQIVRICNSCQDISLDFKRGKYENFVDEDADPKAPPESKIDIQYNPAGEDEDDASEADGGDNSNKDAEKVRELYAERETLMILLAGSVYSLIQAIAGLTPQDVYMIEQGSGACLWRDDFVRHELQVCSAFTPGVSDHDFEIFLPAHFVRRGQGVLDDFVANPPTADYARLMKSLDDFSLFVMPSEPFNSGVLLSSPPMNKEGDTAGDLGLGRQSLLLLWLLTTGDYIRFNGEGTSLAGRLPVNAYGLGPSLDRIVECLGLNQRITLEEVNGVEEWRCNDPDLPMFAGEPSGIPRVEGYEWARLQEYNVYKMSALLRVKNGCDFVSQNPQSLSPFEERDGESILAPNDPDRFFEDNEAFRDDCKSQLKTIAKSAIRTVFARMVGDAATNAMLLEGVYRYRPDGTPLLDPETNEHLLLPLTRSNVQKGEFCLTELQSPEDTTTRVNPDSAPAVPTNPFGYYPKRCEGFEEYIASMAIESVRRGYNVFTPADLPLLWSFWCVKVWKGCQVGGVSINYIQSDAAANSFIRAALDFIERTQTATLATYTASNATDTVTLGQIATELEMQDYPFIQDICNLCQTMGIAVNLGAPRSALRECTLRQADLKVNGANVAAGLALFGDSHVLGPESGLIGKAKKYLGVKNSVFWALQTRLNNESPNDLYDVPLALYEGPGQEIGAYTDALVYHEVPFLPAGGRSVINQKKVSKSPVVSPPLSPACAAIPSNELPDYEGQVKTWAQSTLFPLLFAIPKAQEQIGTGTDKFHAVAFVADPDHEFVEADRENNQSGFYYYVLDKTQANPPVPAVTTRPAFVLSSFASDAICLDAPALDFDLTLRQKGSSEAGVKILEVVVDTEVELVLTVRNNGETPLKNVRIFSDRERRIEKALLEPGEVFDTVVAFTAGSLGRYADYAYATARDADNNSVGPVHDRADLLVSPKLKAFQIRLIDASPLNDKTHPISRYAVLHMRDNGEDIPVSGATTDPESRLRIDIAIGLSTAFGPNQTTLPAEPISLTLKDATVFEATEGFGYLAHLDSDGQVIVTGTQITVNDPTTLGQTTNVYYIPPPVFVRKEFWQQDSFEAPNKPRKERKVRLEVLQSDIGSGVKTISLIRPPVFVFHGLGGFPTTWNEFRPIVPDSGVSLDRAWSVPGYDGRFMLYAAGSNGSVEPIATEAQKNFEIFQQALTGPPLRKYAVARVDVVGNSMGGLLTREISRQLIEWHSVEPIFRKLITIGTPHLGSPVASKIVEIKNATRLDANSTWVDVLVPQVAPGIPDDMVEELICAMVLQNLTAVGSQGFTILGIPVSFPELNIYSGAVEDLAEGSPRIQALQNAGVLISSHYIVGENTTSNLGGGEGLADFTQIGALWAGLAIACNFTPDTTTIDRTNQIRSSPGVVWNLAKLIATGNPKALYNVYRALLGLYANLPEPILPVGNDRIVPAASQRDGLAVNHNAITTVAGPLDHLDIKSYPPGTRDAILARCQLYLQQVWQNLNGNVRHGFTDRTDTACQVAALLEADPSAGFFLQPQTQTSRAAVREGEAPAPVYVKPFPATARNGARVAPTTTELVTIAPVPNAIVSPGQVIEAQIVAPVGVALTDLFAGTLRGSDSALTLSPAAALTITILVTIPTDAVGPERLMLTGLGTDGQPYVASVDLLVNPGALEGLIIDAPSLLLRPGQVDQVFVTGRFADGIERDLTTAARGTSYQSTKPAVLAVDDSGRIQARSDGRATLRVTNVHPVTGARYVETQEIVVQLDSEEPNGIPVADAGLSQTVPTETVIHLSAAASSDPDDDPLTYRWQQTGGRIVYLIDANSAAPYFVSPLVAEPDILTFELTVADDKGAETLPVEVKVTVQP